MLLKVSDAATYLGVSVSTMHRWEREGKLIPLRTKGNQRRYDTEELENFKFDTSNEKYTVAYARVSSSDQKEDLARQVDTISRYCVARGYQFKVIQDVGSGLNYNKKGLNELIALVCSKKINRIVINYKDRLLRFGYEMLEQVCRLNNVKIEIINHTEDKTYEEELVEDVLSVVTVFSARLYGSRSHKSRKMASAVKDVIDEK